MKKSKRFIIACGGTGGHLSPGIALAERLTEKGFACTLLVSKKKIDARLAEKYASLEFIQAPGCAFSLSLRGLPKFLINLFQSVIFGIALFQKERPAAFVSFGGFLTVGLAIASRLLFIPVVLHEANRVPGKAVRWMSRIATRVYLPPGVRLKGITPLAVRSTGFPVRQEMHPCDKYVSREKIGMPKDGKLLAIFGGSQGAKPLNDWIQSDLSRFLDAGVSVFCVTGPGKLAENAQPIEQRSRDGKPVCARFIPFCDDMAAALSAADLVVSRSGAGSLAEFVACGVPAILIPYPFAADNHQEANAKFFREKGAGVVIPQTEIASLTDETLKLIGDDFLLGELRANIEKMSREFDWSNMVSDLERYATGEKRTLKTEQA